MTPEQDYVVKLVENVLTFVRLLSKAKDKEDYMLAVAVFAQCRSSSSLTKHITDRWDQVMGLQVQAGGPMETFAKLREILDKYEMVKKLPFFTKLYKFIMYCVGLSLFEKMGISFNTKLFLQVEEAAIKKEYHMGPDFIHCLLDTILFLTQTGYQCMTTGSLDPILHCESAYEKWIQEGEKLRIESKYLSNPEPHGFTVFDFLSRLDENIEQGKCIVKFISKTDICASIVRRVLNDLQMIKADCMTKRLAQQERKAPFAVLVHGGSSVAKSQFTKLLFYHYGKVFKLPIDDEYKYTRNAFDQYWTNFNTSQWCLQLDDIAYLHPNKAAECDPSLVEMLQVVNNVPYVPTQADLADKGKTPVRSRFVIATSNTENLNAETYFACPLAVQRRLPFVISIEPKPEYMREEGAMIDPAKIPPSVPGEYPDLWIITVKKVVPAGERLSARKSLHMGQTADLVVLEKYDNIHDFLKWFSATARQADGTQAQAMKCDLDMKSVELCQHDIPRGKCDTCALVDIQAQAGEIVVYRTPWVQRFYAANQERLVDEEASQAGYKYTMKSILYYIALGPVWTRVIVWYYMFLMWGMHKWAWFHWIVIYLYGSWYWLFLSFFVIHHPITREFTFYVLGYKAYRKMRSPQALKICAALVTAVTLLKTTKWLIRMWSPEPDDWQPHEFTCDGCTICKQWTREEREDQRHLFECKKADCPRCPMLRKVLNRKPIGFMCYNASCGECVVCLARDEVYRSGRPIPSSWTNIITQITAERHDRICDGTCRHCAMSKAAGVLQGATAERGSSPEPKGDKQENVWYKDNFECTSFDVSPSSLSKVNWTIDQFAEHIAPNCAAYYVRARGEEMVHEKRGRTTCIGGHTYLFNNHCVPYDSFELTLIFQSGKEGVTTNFTMLVTPSQLLRLPDQDLLFVQLPSVPPKKDIRALFAKESFEGRFDGEYLSRRPDGSLYRQPQRALRRESNFTHIDVGAGVQLFSTVWKSHSDVFTQIGDCGSLLISMSAMGPMILGIHVLGGTTSLCIALSVPSEVLYSLPVEVYDDCPPTLQVGDYSQQLVDLNKKATVRYISEGTMVVYGSLAGFRGKMKSRVTKTYMCDLAVRDGYPVETAPPVMNSWVPWRRAMLDMVRPVSHIDLDLLTHCVDHFTRDILSGLSKSDLQEVHVYSLQVAINGKPGLAYVDKMPRNTSAGFPFRKSKKFFLNAVEADDEYQHPVEVLPEVEEEMDRIILGYESGRLYAPVFTASLKDEPTSLKKVAEGKTRVFCGAPIHWSLVVRMYLLPVIRLIQKNRFLFEAGPGTIAQSTEWDDIYKHVTQFGEDRIVAGDYGKFDKRMPASVILAAFQIIKNILVEAGWDEKSMKVVGGIAEDTAFPTIDFHGELIRCYGSNPSGHPLTVIINGLANSLYVRYCYAKNHPRFTCEDFKSNVALMTYGDDLIMGISKSIDWFDHTRMQQTLGDIDIEFTMADKTAESVPFIHIRDATFLRRSWRFEPELGVHVCPLEHASIEKMLTMCVSSKTVSKQLQAVAVLDTAVQEYFWYGREVFEEKRDLFSSWIEELSLRVYMDRDLPTWEQLVNKFKECSRLRV
jgi:hypothetical protein